VLPAPTADTSVAFAATDADGVASYDFRIAWDITATPGDLGGCLHTGSLAAMVPPGAAVVETAMAAARQRGVTISFDPNVRPSLAGPREHERVRIERQVRLSHLVKVSEDDLGWLYPDTDPLDLARRWLDLGPSLVVVTLGPRGAHAVTRSTAVTRPAPVVAVVDTVGAGDSFTSGLLAWLSAADLLGGAADGDGDPGPHRRARLRQRGRGDHVFPSRRGPTHAGGAAPRSGVIAAHEHHGMS